MVDYIQDCINKEVNKRHAELETYHARHRPKVKRWQGILDEDRTEVADLVGAAVESDSLVRCLHNFLAGFICLKWILSIIKGKALKGSWSADKRYCIFCDWQIEYSLRWVVDQIGRVIEVFKSCVVRQLTRWPLHFMQDTSRYKNEQQIPTGYASIRAMNEVSCQKPLMRDNVLVGKITSPAFL